jgi:NIMA (never in mitosis gene a)-related kinase
LKSPNIFLTKGGVVKLGDFGVAGVIENTQAKKDTQVGTPLYMPPEMF